jgi:hypothetical protein
MVVNASDSGAGSLRAAITQVNADTQPGTDTIDFAIGTGFQGIIPLSALPTITHSVIIDGTSQPGFAGTPLIDIEGVSLGTGVSGLLSIAANNCTVEGLNIGYFRWGNGVDIVGSFNTIGGTTPGSGNVISFNGDVGVFIHSGTGNVLEGNLIGTDRTGVARHTNANGVEIDGNSNTVGGTAPGARNLISGNAGNGLTLKGSGNLVEGNFIGTDITGTIALPNGWASTQLTGAVIISGASNTLGGTAPGDGNLISGNPGTGVWIKGVGSVSNVVEGNYVGTDVTGTKALPNVWPMLLDAGANSNLIGGTTGAARNLLVNGINIRGGSGNVVQGNSMGTDVTGKMFLPSLNHIYFFTTNEGNNTIGGTTPAAGNLIFAENPFRISAAPVLTSAVSSNGTITISGTLSRGVSSTYTLNFFSDAAGTAFIGSGSVTTDATGKATFTVTFPGALSPGAVITATSVDALYNTSMLSAGLGTVLAVTGFPSTTTAGAAGAFTVTVRNLDGSTASNYTGTIHFSSSDTQAALPADYTFTAADQGVHTFSAILKTAGSKSLTATDTVTSRIAGSQAGIVVNPAVASQLVINAPSSVTHKVAFSLTLTVEDAYGNVVTGYAGTVHFTSSDSTATLPANYTFTAADAGVHTFVNTTTLRKKGPETITVTDTLNSGLTDNISTSVA